MPSDEVVNGGTQQTALLARYNTLPAAPAPLDEKPAPMSPRSLMTEVNAQRLAVMYSRFTESYGLYCRALLHYQTHAKQPLPELPFEGLTLEATPEKEIENFAHTVQGALAMMNAWKKSENTNPDLRSGLACNLMLTQARMVKTAGVLNDYFEERNEEVKNLTKAYAADQVALVQSLIPAGENLVDENDNDDTGDVIKLNF